MRKIIHGIIVFLVLSISGCSDMIDLTPESDVTFQSYFNSVKDAESLLNTLEDRLRSSSTGSNTYQKYIGWIADNVSSMYSPYVNLSPLLEGLNWSLSYETLSSADDIIDNAHRFPATVDMKPFLLQAYFAKGYTYFNLARMWGEVPIRRDNNDYSALGKNPVPDVLEEATKYALKALDLPNYEDLKDGNGKARTSKQYAGKGAAAALLAHIYAWRAEIEQKPEYWAEAEKYCTMIIDGKAGMYTMAKDPETLCQNEMYRDGAETIWELYRNTTEYYSVTYAYCDQLYVGFPVLTDAYYKPGNSYSYYNVEIYKETVKEMFRPEDRRRDAYFWGVDADSLFIVRNRGTQESFAVAAKYSERGNEYTKYNNLTQRPETLEQLLALGDTIEGRFGNNTQQSAYVIKHRYPFYVKSEYSSTAYLRCFDNNKVIWRLADIYLLRAECRVRQDVHSSGAIADLNEIRERAYGCKDFNYPCADDVAKGLDVDLRLAIFREREKELMFEDHRYYDVVRNGWGRNGERDYVRMELSEAVSRLTDQDILDGALYLKVGTRAFENNDLMRQNVYWNRQNQ